jgi:hypothetical protein
MIHVLFEFARKIVLWFIGIIRRAQNDVTVGEAEFESRPLMRIFKGNEKRRTFAREVRQSSYPTDIVLSGGILHRGGNKAHIAIQVRDVQVPEPSALAGKSWHVGNGECTGIFDQGD